MAGEMTRRDAMKLAGAAGAAAMLSSGGLSLAQDGEVGASPAQPAAAAAARLGEAFAGGEYVLPKLPYGYDALEPQLDARTLQIHHDKHHAGYVAGLNKALSQLQEARSGGQYGRIQELCENLAFNGSGHVLHTLFWHSMTPGGSQAPPTLSRALERDFGSVQAAQEQFAAATKRVEASGWGVLAYEPVAGRLLVLQAGKHQNLTVWGVVPLLVCDVWEHAYYLQYQNNRGEWVDNFMKIANWSFAAERLAMAQG